MQEVKNEKNKRDFKGIWIPKEVFFEKELSHTEMILFVEIDSLDNESGCFASNAYFAEFFKLSENAISRHIAKLKKLGFIKQTFFDGRKRILKSCFKYTKEKADIETSVSLPMKKRIGRLTNNGEYNNISNNTVNNTLIKSVSKQFKIPTILEVKEYCQERKNQVNAEKFHDYYTSKGWLVGKSKMKDWKASVRTWEKNTFDSYEKQNNKGGKIWPKGEMNFTI